MKLLTLISVFILFSSCSKEEDCKCEVVSPNNEGTYYIGICDQDYYDAVMSTPRSEKFLLQYSYENPCPSGS